MLLILIIPHTIDIPRIDLNLYQLNINLNLTVEDVKDHFSWNNAFWLEEEQAFVSRPMGDPGALVSEIFDLREVNDVYEVDVIHYGEIRSWQYPTGNTYESDIKFFYPKDDLEKSTYQFQYNENDNLVVVSCETPSPY